MIKHHQAVCEIFARRTAVVAITPAKPVLKDSLTGYLGRLDNFAPCLAVEQTEPVRVDAMNRARFKLSDAIAEMDSCAS